MLGVTKKRYSLASVFWVVLAVNLFFSLLGIFVVVVLEVSDGKNTLHELGTARSILKQLFGIICQVIFYYYSLNYYNRLMVEKKSGVYYLRYSLLLVILVFTYFAAAHYLLPQKTAMEDKTPRGLLIFSFAMATICVVGSSLLLAYLNNLRDEKKQRKILE